MTQFQPPPDPPGISPPSLYESRPPGRSSRWSAAAISGFVLSLLGCTGVGAVLGLILGIVGIVNTHGGRRRGLGLAVAALPISLITGLFATGTGLAIYTFVKMRNATTRLPEVMGTKAVDVAQGAETLIALATPEFQKDVSADQVQRWLKQAKETHGALVEVRMVQGNPAGSTSDGKLFLNLEGKFVNGRASIKLVFDPTTIGSEPKITDIEVDGLSVRESN